MTTRLRRSAAALLCAALWACHQSAPQPGADRPTILVVPKGSTHDYWRTVRVGASQEAAALNVNLQWPSAFPENDLEAEWVILDQARRAFSAQHRGLALGVALAPLDRHAFVDPVHDMRDHDVPVVVYDSELDGDDYVTFYGTDNRRAGQAAGDELARQLGGHGNVAVLRMNPISDSTKLREAGFLDAVTKYPGIRIVSRDHYAGALVERGYHQALDLLDDVTEQRLALDGVFCPNESTTMGMLRALENRNLTGRVKLVGFDRTARLVNALWNREIAALVVQDPYEMGRKSVKRLVEYMDRRQQLLPLMQSDRAAFDREMRQEFEKTSYVPFRVATRADLERIRAFAPRLGSDETLEEAMTEVLHLMKQPSAPADPDAREVLRLLFPPQVIVH